MRERESAGQFGAEFIDLEKVAFTPEVLRHMPANLAHKHQTLPIRYISHANCLRIVLSNPADLDAVDTLHQELGYDIEIAVAEAAQIRTFIEKLYPRPR